MEIKLDHKATRSFNLHKIQPTIINNHLTRSQTKAHLVHFRKKKQFLSWTVPQVSLNAFLLCYSITSPSNVISATFVYFESINGD